MMRLFCPAQDSNQEAVEEKQKNSVVDEIVEGAIKAERTKEAQSELLNLAIEVNSHLHLK